MKYRGKLIGMLACGLPAIAALQGCNGSNSGPVNPPPTGPVIVALNGANSIQTFRSGAPGTSVSGLIAITGLQANETIVGFDFRPANGQLYGVSNSSRIYTIVPGTGAATLVSTLSVPLNGTSFGVDFNPVPDRLRIISDTEQNLRVNVETGATTVDTPLAYLAGDANVGVNPNIVAAAYSNNVNPAPTTTTLFDIDSNLDILTTQNPANNGTLATIGTLGVNASDIAGFDIGSDGQAFAVFTTGNASALFSINLTSGAATSLGLIGSNVRSISVQP